MTKAIGMEELLVIKDCWDVVNGEDTVVQAVDPPQEHGSQGSDAGRRGRHPSCCPGRAGLCKKAFQKYLLL